jgi:hypothetical protein
MKSQLSRHLLLFRRRPAGGSFRRACVFFLAVLFCASLAGNAQKVDIDSGLIAHEWGTFTSIAAETGQAVEWLPLNNPSDLPNFVAAPASKLGWAERFEWKRPCSIFIPRTTPRLTSAFPFFTD